MSPGRNPRKLSSALLGVAERLRAEREVERFSQYELAAEIGVTRAALSSFELCENPLPFRVGFEFCRRLEVLPRWLATGEEPKRPFIPLAELNLTQEDLRRYWRRGIDFLTGYEAVLRRPIEVWLKRNPTDKIVMRMLRDGPESSIRRMSTLEIVFQLEENLKRLKKSDAVLLPAYLQVEESLLTELRTRIEAWHQKAKR